jgi:23S rRNA (guanosine2251-2'-O)-methyltransferase
MVKSLNQSSSAPLFQIRRCTRETCRLRFTTELADPRAERCPVCRAPTEQIGPPYGQALITQAVSDADAHAAGAGLHLEVLLDNIRSAWNVGSMMRAADGVGVRHVHLCGVSATPDNPKVTKTALGAEKALPWTFYPDGLIAAQAMKDRGMRLWALEGGERSVSLLDAADDLPGAPLGLVAGNELTGVDPGLLEMCERVVSLPMLGVKGSLNVAVAFGIAVYFIRFGR